LLAEEVDRWQDRIEEATHIMHKNQFPSFLSIDKKHIKKGKNYICGMEYSNWQEFLKIILVCDLIVVLEVGLQFALPADIASSTME
jgi:hypothetical protein